MLTVFPGVHATAGPLPAPPRVTFGLGSDGHTSPARPPRVGSPTQTRRRGDLEAVKQALQLPSSVSAALAKSAISSIESSDSSKVYLSSKSPSITSHDRLDNERESLE